MVRISPVDPENTPPRIRAVLASQAERWGAPLLNHLVYARRPTVFNGVRSMWAALGKDPLIDEGLTALVNRRVASHIGCVF